MHPDSCYFSVVCVRPLPCLPVVQVLGVPNTYQHKLCSTEPYALILQIPGLHIPLGLLGCGQLYLAGSIFTYGIPWTLPIHVFVRPLAPLLAPEGGLG